MNWLKREYNRVEPPGLELRILKGLPRVAIAGTLLLAALSLLVRILPPQPGIDPAKHIMNVDIFAIAMTVTFWTGLLTLTIGCIVVHIMKGPAYKADPYPVEHADRPDINSD